MGLAALTDINHQGFAPGRMSDHGEHGEEAPPTPLVYSGLVIVVGFALYVPAGIALTSAYASQLLALTVHVTIGGWALFVVILVAVADVAYLGIRTSSWVDLALVAGEMAVIAALAISILVKGRVGALLDCGPVAGLVAERPAH